MDDFGAFFVSIRVLDKEAKPKYIVRENLGIPIANGIQIYETCDEECELVTIHTVREIFPEIDQFLIMNENDKFELFYEDDIFIEFRSF